MRTSMFGSLRRPSRGIVGVLTPLWLALLPAPHGVAQSGAPARLEFEVSSIKPVQSGKPAPILAWGARAAAANASLRQMIEFAYRISPGMEPAGATGWIQSDQFELEAKAASAVDQADLRKMLQSLLADRFKLAVHFEDRPTTVYVLEVPKSGHKLKETQGPKGRIMPYRGFLGIQGKSATMEQLTTQLTILLTCPVVDQTGLKGFYDFAMEAPFEFGGAASAIPGDNEQRPSQVSDFRPPILTGVPKYLGLKLTERKLPMPVVVIDHAEKPTEN
jgi:uncharacterized protein (TIGR03435 family)